MCGHDLAPTTPCEKGTRNFFEKAVRFLWQPCLTHCQQRQKEKENMNKKLIVMLAAVATAGVMFARPGPGFHGGFHGAPRFHGGPGYHHHHHHHSGWGIAGAALGTAALVNSIVRPPVVVAPAPVYTTPVYTTPVYGTPVYSPAPVVVAPPPPPPVYYRSW